MRNVMLRAAVIAMIAMQLAACKIAPVQHAAAALPDPGCAAIRFKLAVRAPDADRSRRVTESAMPSMVDPNDPLVRSLTQAYQAPAAAREPMGLDELAVPRTPVSPSMLLLSGGSQNGAFGAGFLDEWATLRRATGKAEGLPRFRVVTGISTGALQATFAFLGHTDGAVAEYRIEREEQLLQPLSKGLQGKSVLGMVKGGLTIATKGTTADLQPLRQTLHRLIDQTTLAAVAHEAQAGRRLFVGAVEMDSGEAYAFDLTAAATRYMQGNSLMRECYIEALMASSSVPMVALPVFIDGQMYIDGGARFGVVTDFLADTLRLATRGTSAENPGQMYVLINGTLDPGVKCNLKNCAENPLPPAQPGSVPSHAKWSFDGLALRALSVLISQSYRSSVYLARAEGERNDFTFHFVRIGPDIADHQSTVDLPPEPVASQTCDYWSKLDEKLDNPIEFHPRFMRCAIDYGRTRAQAAHWEQFE